MTYVTLHKSFQLRNAPRSFILNLLTKIRNESILHQLSIENGMCGFRVDGKQNVIYATLQLDSKQGFYSSEQCQATKTKSDWD